MTPSEVFQRWGSVYEDKEKREDIDSIVKKYRTETELGALNLARGIYCEEECERKFDYLALHQIVGNISFLAFGYRDWKQIGRARV